MTSATLTILFGCMFVVAVLFSMVGLGGGVLYTPIQVLVGVDFHTAATTSLFLIMVTSLSATLVFRRAAKVDWPLAIVLETSTVVGGVAGGLASGRFSAGALSVLLALMMVLAAVLMMGDFKTAPVDPLRKPKPLCWKRRFGDQAYSVNLFVALPISFVAGAVSGLLGVGGGILKVPMMVLLFGVPMDIAVGSSAFMIGVTAAGGFAGHLASGHWDWRTSLLLGVAVFIGGQIGARFSLGIDKKKVKKLFACFLLPIAILVLAQA